MQPLRRGKEWSRERERARIWRNARQVFHCDACHERPGLKFTDVYWMCADCSRRYLERLEAERM
jgi:hypothetical protein